MSEIWHTDAAGNRLTIRPARDGRVRLHVNHLAAWIDLEVLRTMIDRADPNQWQAVSGAALRIYAPRWSTLAVNLNNQTVHVPTAKREVKVAAVASQIREHEEYEIPPLGYLVGQHHGAPTFHPEKGRAEAVSKERKTGLWSFAVTPVYGRQMVEEVGTLRAKLKAAQALVEQWEYDARAAGAVNAPRAELKQYHADALAAVLARPPEPAGAVACAACGHSVEFFKHGVETAVRKLAAHFAECEGAES